MNSIGELVPPGTSPVAPKSPDVDATMPKFPLNRRESNEMSLEEEQLAGVRKGLFLLLFSVQGSAAVNIVFTITYPFVLTVSESLTRQTDRQTDRHTDRQADRQTGRQTQTGSSQSGRHTKFI